jgi:hypothetical protein
MLRFTFLFPRINKIRGRLELVCLTFYFLG